MTGCLAGEQEPKICFSVADCWPLRLRGAKSLSNSLNRRPSYFCGEIFTILLLMKYYKQIEIRLLKESLPGQKPIIA